MAVIFYIKIISTNALFSSMNRPSKIGHRAHYEVKFSKKTKKLYLCHKKTIK